MPIATFITIHYESIVQSGDPNEDK